MSARSSACTLVLAFTSFTCNAAILLNENFDGVSTGLHTTTIGPGVGAFTVTGGSIDLIANGLYPGFSCTLPTSVRCVDINGDTPGTVSVPVTFTAPGLYRLAFDLIGSQRPTVDPASATVQLGTLWGPQTFTLAWNDSPATHNYTFNVPAGQVANLSFAATSTGATGLLLDNVLVTDAVGAPEPNPFVLVLAGAILLGAGLWRTRHAKAAHKHDPTVTHI
jgi:hypothetical protein